MLAFGNRSSRWATLTALEGCAGAFKASTLQQKEASPGSRVGLGWLIFHRDFI